MDTAVGLVQAYLHINGYFTVTEYPIIEAMANGGYRNATDLDVLAVRFPNAGRMIPGAVEGATTTRFEPDPELCEPDLQCVDMIIGEVKEGKAELNRGARDPVVLETALTRFGCCPAAHVKRSINDLLRQGRSQMHGGHRVRLMAFGSTTDASLGYACEVIRLAHVFKFIRSYLHEHWSVLRLAQFKQSALSMMMLLEKTRSPST